MTVPKPGWGLVGRWAAGSRAPWTWRPFPAFPKLRPARAVVPATFVRPPTPAPAPSPAGLGRAWKEKDRERGPVPESQDTSRGLRRMAPPCQQGSGERSGKGRYERTLLSWLGAGGLLPGRRDLEAAAASCSGLAEWSGRGVSGPGKWGGTGEGRDSVSGLWFS